MINWKLLLLVPLFIFTALTSTAQHHDHDHRPVHNGSIALDHELIFKDVHGDTTALSLMHGKVVFINIWATWCGPCRDELPGLNELYLRYKDNENVKFLFVDADSNLKKSQRFLDKRNYKTPLYESLNGFPASIYRGAVPTTMVFDREGKLIMHYEGAADYANENFIREFDKFINAK